VDARKNNNTTMIQITLIIQDEPNNRMSILGQEERKDASFNEIQIHEELNVFIEGYMTYLMAKNNAVLVEDRNKDGEISKRIESIVL